MNLLEDLKILLLNFNFVMIYIIHKMLALLKNHLNYLKDNSNVFLRSIIENIIGVGVFFIFLNFFFSTYNDRKFKSCRRKNN